MMSELWEREMETGSTLLMRDRRYFVIRRDTGAAFFDTAIPHLRPSHIHP